MSDKLDQAWDAIEAGDKENGQQLLAQLIKAEPKNVQAWLLLADSEDNEDLRRQCYERVLRINPHNFEARKALGIQPPSSEPRAETTGMKGYMQALLIILGGIIITSLVCYAIISSRDTAQPETVVATPTSSTLPPAPTATSTPDSAAASQYLTDVEGRCYDIMAGMESLAPLFENPQFNDEAWLRAVGHSADVVQQAHRNLSAMNVPPEMAEFHEALLDATQDLYDGMDYLIDGATYMDAGGIQKANNLMVSGLKKMNRATEVLNEYSK